jgi:probable F420-dependent oxidoreductase
MDIGLALFPTDYTTTPGRVAQLAEERGFAALLFPEHTHIPVSRDTPYPGGGELPPEYSHTHDLFVAMAMAAALTEQLEVGSGVCLVPQHDPIITANAIASIDALSNGRVLFGVGAGWNREEMQNHGTDPRRRFKLMRERIAAMKKIWAHDEAEYHGELVDFDPIWCWPKPAQKPHPPVLVGGTGEKVLDRVLAYGDEWMPNRVTDPEALGARIEELCDRAGRHVPVSVFGAKPDAGFLERLAAVGVQRAYLYLTPREPDAVERQLDDHAQFL